MLNEFKKKIIRLINPVEVEQLILNPINRNFGFKRGTPIDRYYIEKFLEKNRKYIKGNICEIAENKYSKLYSNAADCNYEILNFTPSNEATIIGDLTNISSLPKSKIDCFICTQTFNFIYDIKESIKGAYYLLRPNGVLLATVAGLEQISRYDMERWGDYWRFTDLSIRKLFSEVFGVENISVEIYGNIVSATSLLYGIAVEDFSDRSLLDSVDQDYQVLIGITAKKSI